MNTAISAARRPSAHHVPAAPFRGGAQHLYFEAPTYYRPQRCDAPAVFLAGGITGVAERWHARAIEVLTGATPVVILNPHRASFPIGDPSASWEQVSWEQHHLHLAAVTLFWFPACDASVTTQPIAMFELGQALGEGRLIAAGAHPDYPREADVHMLCQLARPGMPVYSSLDDVLAVTVAMIEASGTR
jgi:hypothetical protein